PVNQEEVKLWLGREAELRSIGDIWIVADDDQDDAVPLTAIVRTGRIVDSVTGYQGPTELLLKLSIPRGTSNDAAGGVDDPNTWRVADIRLRTSFDNEPYVGYCKQEYGFWPMFEGQTLAELSSMNLEEAGVEGVSGATMTSMAIAETLVTASGRIIENHQRLLEQERLKNRPWWSRDLTLHVSPADWACFGLLIAFPILRTRESFKRGWMRWLWLLTVVVVIGAWSGNLLSLALLGGWGTRGVAWQLAPLLTAMVFLAVSLPPLTKSNFYCSHLCPHGAVQQAIRPSAKNRRLVKLPRRASRMLVWVPGCLLVIAYLTLLVRPTADLSSWEPFHAYLFHLAPWLSIAFAAITLIAAAFLPMAYCRYGCPTGRLLDYLRRSASSDRIVFADVTAIGLLITAFIFRCFS
ncbi:MAG: 4Fe-4S binding protein, partial [Planctomycetota bacterium]